MVSFSASYAFRMSMNIRFLEYAFLIPDQDHAERIVVMHLKEWLAYVHSELRLLFLLIAYSEVAPLSHTCTLLHNHPHIPRPFIAFMSSYTSNQAKYRY
jgi:hypothetical protein